MEIIRKARALFGNRFTYTLLESGDIFKEHKVQGEIKTAARKGTKTKKSS
jgi:hypothetical protein